jgi:hypothetical protein
VKAADPFPRFVTALDVFRAYPEIFPGPRAVQRAARTGILPPGVVVHVGRRVLVSLPALERFLAAGGTGAVSSGCEVMPGETQITEEVPS